MGALSWLMNLKFRAGRSITESYCSQEQEIFMAGASAEEMFMAGAVAEEQFLAGAAVEDIHCDK